MANLPELFIKRLERIIPKEQWENVKASFSKTPRFSVRINTLKVHKDEVKKALLQKGILVKDIPWIEEALGLDSKAREVITRSVFVEQGFVFVQGLSSMLPVVVLGCKENERVLDMCAAPGAKTTQMAARMNNTGAITALERVKNRFYKLKSVCALLGATNVIFKCLDARKFKDIQGFDRVLVDAPCSSEARFKVGDKKSFVYWSERKIKEMAHKQKGLLLSATRLLKPGGTLVYATCSFAPEENEAVVDWVLKKKEVNLELSDIDIPQVERYFAILSWGKKTFSPDIKKCLRVLPNEEAEGFFIAKFVKTP